MQICVSVCVHPVQLHVRDTATQAIYRQLQATEPHRGGGLKPSMFLFTETFISLSENMQNLKPEFGCRDESAAETVTFLTCWRRRVTDHTCVTADGESSVPV